MRPAHPVVFEQLLGDLCRAGHQRLAELLELTLVDLVCLALTSMLAVRVPW